MCQVSGFKYLPVETNIGTLVFPKLGLLNRKVNQ